MKIDFKILLFALVFAIGWGYFSDLRGGDIAGFIGRLIFVTLLTLIIQFVSQKFQNK